MKRCSCCGDDKPSDSFSVDLKSSDGLQSWCKLCKSKSLNEYYKKHPRKRIGRTKEQGRKRYTLNKVNHNIGRQLRRVLKTAGGKNGYSWERLVGYSLKELREHLERQFKNGMSWRNYGKWHIDHKIPVSKFNIISSDCDDFKKCWALSNLQPLWAKENASKKDRFISE